MKALVLCAGKGTRLNPLTNTIAKPLIPVANRPILFYILDKIQEAGISKIGIVVSPENRSQIQLAVSNASGWKADIEYIVQSEARGLAHAVIAADSFLKTSTFLMFLGDNLIGGNFKSFVANFRRNKYSAYILLKEVADPRFFGVAELDSSGKVIRLEEKPAKPRSNLALVGVYLFDPAIHRAVREIIPSARGELEITDAIQWLLDKGNPVYSQTLDSWWFDTGKREDLLAANRVILEESIQINVKGKIDNLSRVSGNVLIEENAAVINSRITGPVSIASGSKIVNSSIGPFVSLGGNTVIEDSNLENDIILTGSHVHKVENLTDSVIGLYTEISGKKEIRQASALLTGCNVRIEV